MLPSDPYILTHIEYDAPLKNNEDNHDPTTPQASSKKHSHHHNSHNSHHHGGPQGQRTRFTVRELIKIFEVTSANPCKKNKNQVYWQRFIKKGYVFPGRSVNSVNA